MKRAIFILVLMGCLYSINAQIWKVPVYRLKDESKEKMLKLNPRMQLTIRTQVPETDSVKENITCQGLFYSGSMDSLVIKLDSYKSYKEFSDGIKQTTIIPPEIYLKNSSPNNGLMPFALADIGYLRYQKGPKLIGKADDIFEPVIFASLFVLILSPLISYDFKEGRLNTERYKNWALGSTLSMTSCFAILMAINLPNHPKNYQFRSGWPEKKAKVWKFKLTKP